MTRVHDTWADSDSPITVEIYYGGDWHDITDDLGDDGVQITRGRPEWAGHANPAECVLTLNNAGGTYSPRNPNSPLYGLIGRNTPIRIKVTANAATYTRFYGEVGAWPQKWTTKGTAYTPIEAAGVTRRLGQGASPLKSAYRRGCTSIVAPVEALTEYWPLEDLAGSTSLTSGLPGGQAMSIVGSPDLASDSTSFPCSAPLPVATAGWYSYGRIRPATATGELQVRMLIAVPSGGVGAKTRFFELSTTGTASRWMISADTSGNLYLDAYDSSGSHLVDTGAVGFAVNGTEFRLGLQLTQNGADVDWSFGTLEPGASSGLAYSDTLPSKTVGSGVGMLLAPDSALTGCTVGHVTVQTSTSDAYGLADLLNAYSGDTAADRVSRLCAEEGITDTITGTAAASELMGYQLQQTLLDLLAECETTDLGALHEPRAAEGLQYRVRDSVCAQDPAVTIPYTDNLLLPFEPVEDDRTTRNLVKVTRIGGTSSISEVTSGPLNTSDPTDDPDGVGLYDEDLTLSLAADAQTAGQAQWRTHLGTVDEARWPKVGIELAHPTLRADTALTAAVLGVDIGDRIVITDPPDWLPPDDVDQVVCGYEEEITPTRYKITLSCTPYSPYRVLVWDDTDSRWSGDGTVLVGPVATHRATFAGASCLSGDWDDPATDDDVRVRVALTDWTPATEQTLASKYVNAGNQRSWAFDVSTAGNLHLYLSTNGSGYTGVTSTAATGFTDGTYHWVRWTRVAATGTVQFLTSVDGETWAQLGADVASGVTGALYASTGLYQVGARSGTAVTSAITGVVSSVRVLDGIDGDDLVSSDVSVWTDGYAGSGTGTVVAVETLADVTAPAGVEWTHADGDYDVLTGGERMTVTGSVNGVVKSHSSGAAIDVAAPVFYGL